MTKTTTTMGITMRDAYEMGRYVTRHPRTAGTFDRRRALIAEVDALFARGRFNRSRALEAAYFLGRDKLARTGEH